jgi:dTDP-4-dehydrorhamnose reductase
MKVLLVGANGQVGTELRRVLASPEFALTAHDRAAVDLTNEHQLRHSIRSAAPDIVINAAAYTAVDKAESEPELARTVNAIAPGIMAEECTKVGALLIHYSTDYVFDGTKRTPYVETDPVAPINVYGQTKLAGEQAIAAVGCRHWILRVAWVYSAHGKNFLLTVLRLAREGKPLHIVDDQIGVPTSAALIAETTRAGLLNPRRPNGIFHFSPRGQVSWFGFAQEILRQLDLTNVAVEPIPTSGYPTPAKRPSHSVLCSNRLRDLLAVDFGTWQDALHKVVSAMRMS